MLCAGVGACKGSIMMLDFPCPQTPRVSVVIVAKSKLDLLRACLQSVARFAPGAIPFETIVVLNEAGADAEAELRAMATGVKVARSPVNLGFAGGANRGRSLAHGEFLLLLHDDAEVQAGWMEALVQTADDHPEAGAVGSKVFYPDGRLQGAGWILWRDGLTSPPWIGKAPAPTALDRPRAVDYCGTSSLLVRAAAWDAVGGLEESLYPAYYVDVDLSMALRRLGFVVLYQPASRIFHHHAASSDLHLRMFVVQRNRQVFMEKWGEALEGHDLPERDSPSAIARAMARAEAFAEDCRRKGAPVITPPTTAAAFDPMLHELRGYERNRVFQNAYVNHLIAALERAEVQASAERDALSAAIKQLTEALEAAEERARQTSAERDALAAASNAMLGSSSWRLTAPLRATADLLRRFKRRQDA
jgi:GT2 family glycosyltransferase